MEFQSLNMQIILSNISQRKRFMLTLKGFLFFKVFFFHHHWCHQVLLWKAILKIAPLTHNRYTKYKSNHRQNRFLLCGQNCVDNKIDRKWQALHPQPSQRALLPSPIYAVIVQYLLMHKMNLTRIYWLQIKVSQDLGVKTFQISRPCVRGVQNLDGGSKYKRLNNLYLVKLSIRYACELS